MKSKLPIRLPKGESFVSMVQLKDKIFVASTKRVFVVEGDCVRELKIETLPPLCT